MRSVALGISCAALLMLHPAPQFRALHSYWAGQRTFVDPGSEHPVAGVHDLRGAKGSPTWTRTKNLPINSRLLCQLSYRGLRARAGKQ